MRRAFGYLNLFCLSWLVMAAGGCSSVTPDQSSWVAARGGLVSGDRQSRAERALARLRPALAGRVEVRVDVLNMSTLAAYSWPDGRLFVSRGLVESLTEPELAAALAHELGHLCNDGHLQTVFSLRGGWTNPDAEVRADATGAQILRANGIDAAAMQTMLAKVRVGLPDTPAGRKQIDRRLALLRAAGAAQ
ncbi:MAG TPA: M48 family metalloprotease [Tepidisphaeraceae bacterium]